MARKLPIANVFESDAVIAGGVLRGALATALKAVAGLGPDAEIDGSIPPPWDALGRQFNGVRFTHAFPVKRGTTDRPVQPPLSLVKDASESLHDVALLDRPTLFGRPPGAPAFAIDWKRSDDVWEGHFGWSEAPREMRVRTAIDRTKRRALDENLFAYEMIVPDGHDWLGGLDLSRIDADDLPAVEAALRTLLGSELLSIGKTKARVRIDIAPAQHAARVPSDINPLIVQSSSLWVITLQTPALLCDPSRLDEASGECELHDAYSDAWHQLSGRTLSLVRFFASQSLMGRYLAERFQPGKPYNPFLLTDAGSVFVLAAMDGGATAAGKVVQDWFDGGLPLPQWAIGRYVDSWKTCPFRPVDGFGEIAVNLRCRDQQHPQGAPFHVVP